MEPKVLDKYGTELKAGDSVCFIHKYSMQTQYVVKAVIKEIRPMKDDPRFPGLNKNKGWLVIDRYVDDYLNDDDKAVGKVLAERAVKCYEPVKIPL